MANLERFIILPALAALIIVLYVPGVTSGAARETAKQPGPLIDRAIMSGAYPYGPKDTLIGMPETHTIKKDESLIELAPEFDVGYNEIADANPAVDPWVPDKGTIVNIPTFRVLPNAPRRGIVINLAEMRLYFYFSKLHLVISYPIGIGMQGFSTPVGVFRISQKIRNPAWHVPPSIREQDPELPRIMPPGADNPMGRFAMRLSLPAYLIHGTNRPFCVGLRASHGCIRLYNRDIRRLFHLVRENTPVTIVYQPVKVGVRSGVVYIEAHRDYLHRGGNPMDVVGSRLEGRHDFHAIDMKKIGLALKERTGMPVAISTSPKSTPGLHAPVVHSWRGL